MLEFRYVAKNKIIRADCSECGNLVFGIENITDPDISKTIDIVDKGANMLCSRCNES